MAHMTLREATAILIADASIPGYNNTQGDIRAIEKAKEIVGNAADGYISAYAERVDVERRDAAIAAQVQFAKNAQANNAAREVFGGGGIGLELVGAGGSGGRMDYGEIDGCLCPECCKRRAYVDSAKWTGLKQATEADKPTADEFKSAGAKLGVSFDQWMSEQGFTNIAPGVWMKP